MGIRTVRQLRSFQFKETKGEKGSIQFTGSVDLLVICDSAPNFGAIKDDKNNWIEFNNRKIPQINDVEMVGSIAFIVTSRDFSYYDDENEYCVKVTVNYDSKPEKDNDEENKTDEERTWLKISIQSLQERRPASESNQDDPNIPIKPPLNSAGDPVDGLEEDTALLRLTFTNTNVEEPDFPKLFTYLNTCNQIAFLGAEPYTLRVTGYGADFDQKNQVWSVSVEWTYNPADWRIRYFDVGFHETAGSSGSQSRIAIMDKAGNPVSKPVPLNPDGTAKAVGEPPDLLSIMPYDQRDFTTMLVDCGLL
jgi:hypothetical protein